MSKKQPLRVNETLAPEIELIRTTFAERGILQIKAADLTGITRPWANEILTGRRSASPLVLLRFAQLAGITADQLRAVNRDDVAVMVEGTPIVGIEGISTKQLADELARRVAATK